jgi:hypothetical protein
MSPGWSDGLVTPRHTPSWQRRTATANGGRRFVFWLLCKESSRARRAAFSLFPGSAAGHRLAATLEESAAARGRLVQQMTPAQIAEAQRRAQEWTAAFEKPKT